MSSSTQSVGDRFVKELLQASNLAGVSFQQWQHRGGMNQLKVVVQ